MTGVGGGFHLPGVEDRASVSRREDGPACGPGDPGVLVIADGHRRLRPARGAVQRLCAEPALPQQHAQRHLLHQ